MGLLSRAELEGMGFAALGDDLRVSEKASFYGVPRISLGDHTRIDDFCVLSAGSGGIRIGRNVHVAVYTSLIGAGAIDELFAMIPAELRMNRPLDIPPAMGEMEFRMKSSRVKADQVKASGAGMICTICENCHTQLTDLNQHYELGLQVESLANLVAHALVQP